MSFITPIAGTQVGNASGGGLLDKLKSLTSGGSGAAGVTAATDPAQTVQQGTTGTKGDGSVGLMDGVLMKGLLLGGTGAGIGFFAAGPVGAAIGGVLGAVAGAGIGAFMNFRKIKKIQAENQAFLAQIGVQPQTQEEQQLLLSGNIKQLYENASNPQQQAGQVGQADQTGQAVQQSVTVDQSAADAEQQAIIQQQEAAQQAAAQQSQQAAIAAQQAAQQSAGTTQQAALQSSIPAQEAPASTSTAAQQSSAQVMGAEQASATLATGGGTAPTPPTTDSAPNVDLKNVLTDAEMAALDPTPAPTTGSNGGPVTQADLIAWNDRETAKRRKRIQQMWLTASPEQRQQMKLRAQLKVLQHQVAELQGKLQAAQGASGVSTAQAA